MDLKVGDEVTIRKDLNSFTYGPDSGLYINAKMKSLAGQKVTIAEIVGISKYPWRNRYRIKGSDFSRYDWTPCMFEQNKFMSLWI